MTKKAINTMSRDKTDKTPAATAAKQAVNEWGIPDWRDPAAYGDVTKWSFNRWRWEFYRRRDDLRAYYDAHIEKHFKVMSEYIALTGSDLDPRVVFVDDENKRKFGYIGIPDPRISDAPEYAIKPFDFGLTIYDPDHELHAIYGVSRRAPLGRSFRERLAIEGIQLTDEQKNALSDILDVEILAMKHDEVAILFNVANPIPPQIKTATTMLENFIDRTGRPTPKKRQHHKNKWLGYLRTLDAKEAKASWQEIAQLHPHTAQTKKTETDALEAADALRYDF